MTDFLEGLESNLEFILNRSSFKLFFSSFDAMKWVPEAQKMSMTKLVFKLNTH